MPHNPDILGSKTENSCSITTRVGFPTGQDSSRTKRILVPLSEDKDKSKNPGTLKIRQSKINSSWVAGPIGQMNRRPSVWCSKYYFFRLFIDLGHSKLFTFILVFLLKNKKIDWKYFCKEFCKKSWKKIILGTSDTWSTIHLSHRPSEPVYYIVDWRIYGKSPRHPRAGSDIPV